jgi:hypothetical protein
MILSYPLPPLQSVVQGTSIQFHADLPAGATRVQWSVNGVVSKTGTYTPTAAPRRHTLKLTCFDAAGLQLSSATGKLDVTVKPVEPPPPPPVEEPPPVVEPPPPTPEPEPPPVVTIPPSEPPTIDVRTLPLVSKASMAYQGAFRLPTAGVGTASSFAYSSAFAVDTRTHSIFGVGHNSQQMIAEYAPPEIRNAPTAGLLRGTAIQPFADATGGRRTQIIPMTGGNEKIGGLLPWGEKLIVSVYEYYDANKSATASHIVAPRVLSDGALASGPFRLDAGGLNPGFVAGYMASVPEEWRALLGGPAITGQCGLSIISRTSDGHCLFTFNPDDLGVVEQPKATPLLYFPLSNPLEESTRGEAQAFFNRTTSVKGVAIPNGSRSVLFFGWHGAGTLGYGTGTADPALVKPEVRNPDGSIKDAAICYDPDFSGKGNHAYPYVRRVWAYDLLDLIKVKDGLLKPWEPRPYAIWDLDYPIGRSPAMSGATYDTDGNRLFIGHSHVDGDMAVIYVYSFDQVQ